jgi:hypothetical protein
MRNVNSTHLSAYQYEQIVEEDICFTVVIDFKINLSLSHAVEAYRILRRQHFHIF